MNPLTHCITLALLASLVIACSPKASAPAPAAQELTGTETGHYCGMLLSNHRGPKAHIFVAGREQPFWFSSVTDMFSFTFLPEEPKTIVAIYVNDMGRANWDKPEAGTWIDARSAWYVVGSSAIGGMGHSEIVPFADRQSADLFTLDYGGEIVRFEDVEAEQVLASPDTSHHPMHH